MRKELEEFVKTSSSIKLFIEMNIPKIEDGNNFGVAVQESILSQLSRIIDNAMKLSESSTRFWAYRGKLVSKVLCDEVRYLLYFPFLPLLGA